MRRRLTVVQGKTALVLTPDEVDSVALEGAVLVRKEAGPPARLVITRPLSGDEAMEETLNQHGGALSALASGDREKLPTDSLANSTDDNLDE